MIRTSGKCKWKVKVMRDSSIFGIFTVLKKEIFDLVIFNAQLLMFDFSVRIYSLFITFLIKIIIFRVIRIIIIYFA